MSLCHPLSRTMVFMLAASSLSAYALPARAQEASTGGNSPHVARQETVKLIVDRIRKEAGVAVMADSFLDRQVVTPPDTAVTRDTLEEYLTRLTRRLPAGTVWIKLYLPPATEGHRYIPDAVAQLASAQIGLLGRPAPDTVQIQGKTLSVAEAAPLIRALGLEPVYVLTSKQRMAASSASAGAGSFTADSSAVMDALTKQLGVSRVNDIPSGTYKVTVPGANGEMVNATINVENNGGQMRVGVQMRDSSGPGDQALPPPGRVSLVAGPQGPA